jgi:dipeptidyl aminopeptidase/acylaminoacyl peptidase
MSLSFPRRQLRSLAVLTLAVLLSGAAAAAEPPIPIADFVRLGNFSAPAMSPNGKYLVVTQRASKEPRDEYSTVVYELAGMKVVSAVRAGQVGDIPWRHTWVSDTRFVTSLAREFGSVGLPWVTGEIVAANADGRGSAYLYGYRRMNSRTSGSFGTLTNDEGYGRLAQVPRSGEARILMGENPWARGATARTSRLYEIDTVTAGRRTVTEINQPGFRFLVDSDGKPRFAVGADDDADYAVFKLDDDKREWLPFANAEKGDRSPVAISLDNTKLLSALSVERGPRALVSEGIDGSGRRTLVSDAAGDINLFESGLRFEGPFAAGTSVGVPKLTYIVDPTRSDAALHKTLSAQFPEQYVHFAGVSMDGTRTLFGVSSDRDPGAVYVFDAASGKAALLYENRPWVKPERMAEQRPINFKARDGTQLHGYLTLPPSRGDSKLPLVLLPHGGPHGIADTWFFNNDAQFLASRGYAVLQINFRGSGGRGPGFEAAGYRKWGGLMIDDLVDGVRWIAAQGTVDDKRICSFGASFGAYAAMMTAIRAPELVKCAVGYAGVYDLPMIYDEPDAKLGGKAYRYYLRALGQDMGELNSYSPTRLADKLAAPVLLVHGSADEVTPPAQAQAMREALIKAGRPPEWFYVSGEGHGFYAEKNRQAFYEKLEAFLAKHIGKP